MTLATRPTAGAVLFALVLSLRATVAAASGKGLGGALTDLECHHIIRDTIGPA